MNHLQPVANFNVTEYEVLLENGIFNFMESKLANFTNKSEEFMKTDEHHKHHYFLYTVSKIPLQKDTDVKKFSAKVSSLKFLNSFNNFALLSFGIFVTLFDLRLFYFD